MAKITSLVLAKWAEHDRILDALYRLLPVGVEQHDIGVKAMAETFDTTPSKMGDLKVLMDELGILASRTTWRQSEDPLQKGKTGHWTLLVDKPEAERRIRRYRDGVRAEALATPPQKRKPRQPKLNGDAVIMAPPTVRESQLVASVGPDAEQPMAALLRMHRKDPPYAQLEAARQYANRKNTLQSKLEELAAAGITLKAEALDVFDFEPDPVMDAIGTVLPFVDHLERNFERLLAFGEEQRQKIRAQEGELRGLRRMNTPHVAPTVVHGD